MAFHPKPAKRGKGPQLRDLPWIAGTLIWVAAIGCTWHVGGNWLQTGTLPAYTNWFQYVLFAGAAIGLFRSVRYVGKMRAVENRPMAKIRSASQGMVELSGYPRPLTPGRECTRCGVPVAAPFGTSEPFLLDDGSGICLIEPAGATWFGSGSRSHVHLSEDRLMFVRGFLRTDESRENLLHKLELNAAQAQAKARVEVSLKTRQGLAAADVDHDGVVSMAERHRAFASALEAATEKYWASVTSAGGIPVVRCPDDPTEEMVISNEDERATMRTMRFFWAMFVAISVLMLLASALLVRGH